MSFALQNPIGLLGLLSLPVIFWLHRYVVAGQPRIVSCLALWQEPGSEASEGSTARRPPLTLVLLLELLAATLASLALAGFEVRRGAAHRPHLNIVLDTSASMDGGPSGKSPWQETLGHLERLAEREPSARWRVILSGAPPTLLGGAALPPADALARLRALRPHAPHHDIEAALELLSLFSADLRSTLLFSDDGDVAHSRLVRVGAPAPNVGFIAAGWNATDGPFAVIAGFGSNEDVEVTIARDGEVETRHIGGAGIHGNVLRISVDPGVRRVDVSLPDDALAADNHVTLLRPQYDPVSLLIAHSDEALHAALERLGRAIPDLVIVDAPPADIIVSNGASPRARHAEIEFRDFAVRHALFRGPRLQMDPFEPLLTGIDAAGLVWSAGAPSDHGDRILVGAPGFPLLWRHGTSVVVNVDLAHSNLLRHEFLPIFFANLTREVAAQRGGLQRRNFRVGEPFEIRRPPAWENTAVELLSPSGRTRHYPASEAIAGTIDEAGLHTLRVGGEKWTFAANFLDPHESNLGDRGATTVPPPTRAEQVAAARGPARMRQLLLMAMALILLSAWIGASRAHRRA